VQEEPDMPPTHEQISCRADQIAEGDNDRGGVVALTEEATLAENRSASWTFVIEFIRREA
jgi:hypothetical protein